MRTLSEVMNTFTPDEQAEIMEGAKALLLEDGLQRIREELNLSQKELALAMGTSQPAVAQIEQRGNELKIATLKRYVEAMGGELSLAIKLPMGETKLFNI